MTPELQKRSVRQIGSARRKKNRSTQATEIPEGGAVIVPLGPLIKKTWGDRLETTRLEIEKTLEDFGLPATPEFTALILRFIHDMLERHDLSPAQEFRHCRTFVFSNYEQYIGPYVDLCTRVVEFVISMPAFERNLFRPSTETKEESIPPCEIPQQEQPLILPKNVVSLAEYRKQKRK